MAEFEAHAASLQAQLQERWRMLPPPADSRVWDDFFCWCFGMFFRGFFLNVWCMYVYILYNCIGSILYIYIYKCIFVYIYIYTYYIYVIFIFIMCTCILAYICKYMCMYMGHNMYDIRCIHVYGLGSRGLEQLWSHAAWYGCACVKSGQIIATSHDLTPKGG